jgi:hypothetical protein
MKIKFYREYTTITTINGKYEQYYATRGKQVFEYRSSATRRSPQELFAIVGDKFKELLTHWHLTDLTLKEFKKYIKNEEISDIESTIQGFSNLSFDCEKIREYDFERKKIWKFIDKDEIKE